MLQNSPLFQGPSVLLGILKHNAFHAHLTRSINVFSLVIRKETFLSLERKLFTQPLVHLRLGFYHMFLTGDKFAVQQGENFRVIGHGFIYFH